MAAAVHVATSLAVSVMPECESACCGAGYLSLATLTGFWSTCECVEYAEKFVGGGKVIN